VTPLPFSSLSLRSFPSPHTKPSYSAVVCGRTLFCWTPPPLLPPSLKISPFDPASTPSRGVRVGASVSSVFATPKWQIRVPLTYSPSPYRNGTDPGGGGGSGDASSSSPFHVLPHEDTPVDRSAPRPASGLPSKRVQESPLMGRGGVVRGQPHPLDNPVPLGRKGKERQGGGRR
jgi:hypothetical protein